MNSRDKGKRGELEFAALLRDAGWEARRGQQHAGGGDSPDVVTNVPGVHFEVKRVEAGNLYNWLHQATRDAGRVGLGVQAKTPVVAHRKNDQDWVAILRMEDFLALLETLYGRQEDSGIAGLEDLLGPAVQVGGAH